jgi:hypothetical protein
MYVWNWCLNSGLHGGKARTLSLEAHLKSILVWLFWIWDLVNYSPGLASNLKPPDLSLPSSWDYRCELPLPSFLHYFDPAKISESILYLIWRLLKDLGPIPS